MGGRRGHLAIERANQVWALDTTYIPMARGFVYLTAVIDWASRKVLAHRVAITLEACHAVEVLMEAFARHHARLSDQHGRSRGMA